MRSKERYYETDTGEIVNENDRRGRRLVYKPGDEIPDKIAIKFGLMVSAPDTKKVEEPEPEKLKVKTKRKPKGKSKGKSKGKGLTINKLDGDIKSTESKEDKENDSI